MTNTIGPDQIKKFLSKANRNGYGNELIKEINEPDGSHTIKFVDGNWGFHDNYFGGEPFGGREVISFENRPVWLMVYYGFVLDNQLQKQIYSFLKQALLNFTDDLPYRGPLELKEGDWNYKNIVTGEFANFSGTESISYQRKVVYQAKYQGGLVDKN